MITPIEYPPRHPEKKPYDPKTSEHPQGPASVGGNASIVYPDARASGQRII